jgi:hypothetical protein
MSLEGDIPDNILEKALLWGTKFWKLNTTLASVEISMRLPNSL